MHQSDAWMPLQGKPVTFTSVKSVTCIQSMTSPVDTMGKGILQPCKQYSLFYPQEFRADRGFCKEKKEQCQEPKSSKTPIRCIRLVADNIGRAKKCDGCKYFYSNCFRKTLVHR